MKEDITLFKCMDCNYTGCNFEQVYLPHADGDFSNYWICPDCFNHSGYILEISMIKFLL